MKVQKTFTLTIAAALVFSLAACQPQDQAATAQSKTVSAQTITLSTTEIPVVDAAPGAVISEQQVQVASRLMGYLRDIVVHEGDAVKTGQLLFTIDPTDIKGQVDQARAGVVQAEAALNDAQADFERFSNLYKEESIPKLQYDKVKLQYNIAQSQASAARAGLNTAESQLTLSVFPICTKRNPFRSCNTTKSNCNTTSHKARPAPPAPVSIPQSHNCAMRKCVRPSMAS